LLILRYLVQQAGEVSCAAKKTRVELVISWLGLPLYFTHLLVFGGGSNAMSG
jgi:hypothetical protein